MMETKVQKEGLDGIVAGHSSITFIDGIKGILAYRGIDIRELVKNTTFEEIIYLLWYGKLPRLSQLKDLEKKLADEREIPDGLIDLIRKAPKDSHPMAVLRTAVSFLSFYDTQADDNTEESNLRKGIRIVSSIPTIVATFDRIRNGKEPIAPKKDLSLAGNFIYMLSGKQPSPSAERALDMYLILLADHEFNASTFAGRVTIATLSDIYSAVVSGIGALKGDLHGSANRRTMEMVLKIGSVDEVDSYIDNALAQKKKIMGFGHRVYKTNDPRAAFLQEMSKTLGEEAGEKKWYEISEKIRQKVWNEKKLFCNVDFFSATVLYYVGIPVDLFTTIFACSRSAGWVAHVIEQLKDNRLIRPVAEYIGPSHQSFVPLSQRK